MIKLWEFGHHTEFFDIDWYLSLVCFQGFFSSRLRELVRLDTNREKETLSFQPWIMAMM